MTSTHRRSSEGCWTCRLRKKKCDESHPRCNICATLNITCHFMEEKPRWMDSGSLQSQMLMQIKREVREHAHRRARDYGRTSHAGNSAVNDTNGEKSASERPLGGNSEVVSIAGHNLGRGYPDPNVSRASVLSEVTASTVLEQAAENQVEIHASDLISKSRAEKMMIHCFSEFVLPTVFAAYHPCIHDGGRAWISEMIPDSSMIREIACLQTSFYSAISRNRDDLDILETSIRQLGRSVLTSAIVTTSVLAVKAAHERVPGGMAILLSILLMQHFDIATSTCSQSLDSLDVAIKVFEQLLMHQGTISPMHESHIIRDILDLLDPAAVIAPEFGVSTESVERACLKFVIGQLIFDDIIGSTTLGKSPLLRRYYGCLLGTDNANVTFELEKIVGCSSFVLIHISNIAELAEWKHNRKRSKTFDLMDFVSRVRAIKEPLEQHLSALDSGPSNCSFEYDKCCGTNVFERRLRSARSHIWTHAALLYLHVVAAGFQSDHVEVQNHITSMLIIFEEYRHDSKLLQSVSWPFCVSGCLANETQKSRFNGLSQDLHATAMSGSIRAAHTTMGLVWSREPSDDRVDTEFAGIFRDQPNRTFLF